MLLDALVRCSAAVAETSSRKAKIAALADCLRAARAAGPDAVEIAVAFLAGRMRQGRIGLGYAAVIRHRPTEHAATPTLTLREVDDTLARIAGTSGAGSNAERMRLYQGLLGRATAGEQELLMRLLMGELRQGALEGILLEAVAQAAEVPAADLRRAVMLTGDVGLVSRSVFEEGAAGLGRFDVQLFRPVKPMLAQTCEEPTEAIERFAEAALDFKLDGARIQVHKAGDVVRVYTRTQKEVTLAVPEVVERVLAMPAREIILDGEVIALREDGTPHPFQTTMRRFGRKLDVERMRGELPVVPFFFDCLYADGQSLIDLPGRARFAQMPEVVGPDVVRRIITSDPAVAEAFLDEALRIGHEGIMAKSLDAPYAAGNRGAEWLKIKPAHTLDLVVLAAEWGHGRRQGWLSNLHLGARNPDGSFTMLGKTFKGMTDEILRWQTEKLQTLAVGQDDHVVHVKPELVVEIAVSDIQTSPRYEGGLALRLARIKRYRSDKRAEDADTIDTVRKIHAGLQKKR